MHSSDLSDFRCSSSDFVADGALRPMGAPREPSLPTAVRCPRVRAITPRPSRMTRSTFPPETTSGGNGPNISSPINSQRSTASRFWGFERMVCLCCPVLTSIRCGGVWKRSSRCRGGCSRWRSASNTRYYPLRSRPIIIYLLADTISISLRIRFCLGELHGMKLLQTFLSLLIWMWLVFSYYWLG
jgi:hypothetical protein